MHRIQGYIQIHQLTNQAFRDLFKAGLRQSGKHIHIHADPIIQSRGEEQGRGAGGGGASGRKEQRAGEGTDLGGLGRLQGGAATGGGRVPAGRRTGSQRVPCRRRTRDESPAGRRSCRVGAGQGPCRPQGGLGAAGGGRRGGWRRRRRRRDASRGTLEADPQMRD